MTDIHYFGRFPYDDLDLIAEALEMLAEQRALTAEERTGAVATAHRAASERAGELERMAYAEQRRRSGGAA
jgi:hypothetical protein